MTDAGYFGPELSLVIVPIWSAALSSGVVLAAVLIGAPTRLPAVSRIWHRTAVGIVTVAEFDERPASRANGRFYANHAIETGYARGCDLCMV